jgi:hypothetical protein
VGAFPALALEPQFNRQILYGQPPDRLQSSARNP